jgi:hypothetical protein
METDLIITHLKNSNLYSYEVRDAQEQVLQTGFAEPDQFQAWLAKAYLVSENRRYQRLRARIAHPEAWPTQAEHMAAPYARF